jgi:desulfoferrodoxin (superoxide reductase-like protein)
MNKSVQQFFNLFQQVYMQSSMAINIEFHLNRLEFFITYIYAYMHRVRVFSFRKKTDPKATVLVADGVLYLWTTALADGK